MFPSPGVGDHNHPRHPINSGGLRLDPGSLHAIFGKSTARITNQFTNFAHCFIPQNLSAFRQRYPLCRILFHKQF